MDTNFLISVKDTKAVFYRKTIFCPNPSLVIWRIERTARIACLRAVYLFFAI